MLKDGDTERFDCDGCTTEFEVTLEPKARGYAGPPGTPAGEPRPVLYCPFCGKLPTRED